MQAALRELCSKDILFWINTFCWTYEPRPEKYKALGYNDAHLLFITWKFQDEFIEWLVEKIEDDSDALLEKSRDMGASWLVLLITQWYWQFGGPGNDIHLGSRKEEFVDKLGELSALFPKIRYQIRRQPQWLLPKGFDFAKHSSYMRIKNPETESTITGESNNAYFGTSSRKRFVLFDEFAKWEHTDESAWQSVSDVTDCKIAVSSANGRNNMFYKLRAGKAGDVPVYRMHWKVHPLKDKEWYEKEKARRTPQDLAAEVDIDYTASISNKAWPKFSYHRHVTTESLYNTKLPITLACDFNIQPMSWILIHYHSPMTLVFDEMVNENRTRTEDHIKEFVDKYENHENKLVYLYGDATGRHGHTSSKQSNYDIIKKVLAENGWRFEDYVPTSNPSVVDRLDSSNKRLSDWERHDSSFVLINEKCNNFIDSLEQTKRKDDGIDKSDDVDHPAEAWSYFEVARFPITNKTATNINLGGF